MLGAVVGDMHGRLRPWFDWPPCDRSHCERSAAAGGRVDKGAQAQACLGPTQRGEPKIEPAMRMTLRMMTDLRRRCIVATP